VSDPVKLIRRPIEAMISRIPGAGFMRDVVVAMGRRLLGGLVDFVSGAGGGGAGGNGPGNVTRTLAFVRAQAGKPYVWAASGPGGYDCSGLGSAALNVYRGRPPYSRVFTTHNQAQFFRRPGPGVFTAGWANAGERGGGSVGHTAFRIGNLPFESRGGDGVVVGPNATPVTSFAHVGHYASGGHVELRKVAKVAAADFGSVTLAPGANVVYNGLGRPERLEERSPVTSAAGQRLHPDDIDLLADAIGAALGRALLGTVPSTRAAARQAGRRPGR
jgi:hypothetical protein